jgi:hypothetical protein
MTQNVLKQADIFRHSPTLSEKSGCPTTRQHPLSIRQGVLSVGPWLARRDDVTLAASRRRHSLTHAVPCCRARRAGIFSLQFLVLREVGGPPISTCVLGVQIGD